jgi:hypothetical protein
VTFFGVFPVTWDLRSPDSRRRTVRRERANVRVCSRNGTADFERKSVAGRVLEGQRKMRAARSRRTGAKNSSQARRPRQTPTHHYPLHTIRSRRDASLPPRLHHTAAPTPRCSPPNRERPAADHTSQPTCRLVEWRAESPNSRREFPVAALRRGRRRVGPMAARATGVYARMSAGRGARG